MDELMNGSRSSSPCVTEHPLERGIHTRQMAVEVGDEKEVE